MPRSKISKIVFAAHAGKAPNRRTPTQDEQIVMILRHRSGDADALPEILARNEPLVQRIAWGWSSKSQDFEDICQDGRIGLMLAVETYDISRGVRFATHACWKILGAVTAQGNCPLSQFGCRRDYWRKVLRAMAISERECLPLDDPSLLRRSGIVRDRVTKKAATRIAARIIGISRLVTQSRGWKCRGESHRLYLESVPCADRNEGRDAVLEALVRAIATLSEDYPRDAELLRMRFGLDDFEPATLAAIGEHFGITKEAVRQAQGRAIGRLAGIAEVAALKEEIR